MPRWLDPLRQALDRLGSPVTFFCRDDDAGWEHDRLFALLDLFAVRALPLDLAVIPQALTPTLARQLQARMAWRPASLGVHQHGFAHVNHEPTGRKYEFGPSRGPEAQRHDIAQGRQRLRELLGPCVAPLFTPPWNRCTVITGSCLTALGFRALSRDGTAAPLGLPALAELPVRVDWFARRHGVRLDRTALGFLLAQVAITSEPVGIMFHHAMMDAAERAATDALLTLLATHPLANCVLMQSLVETGVPQSDRGGVA